MPVGRAIQFKGITAVIDCYKNNDIPAFAVCYDKNINFKYSGNDIDEGTTLLTSFLELLKNNGSNAVYTLRLYEDLDGKNIRSNTDYDMAFNFVCNEESQSSSGNMGVVQAGFSNNAAVNWLTEISNLKTELAIRNMELEQAEELIEVMEKEQEQLKQNQQPQKGIGMGLIEKVLPGLLGKILNIDAVPETALAGAIVDEEKMINDSVLRLKGKLGDFSLGQVLNRIAEVNEKTPQVVQGYLSMLMK